jgi:hypothetical protein
MSGLLNTLLRTVVLDDDAYREWKERPNLFLRGILLIVVVSLVAGLVTFGVNLVSGVRPVDMAKVEQEIRNSFEQQSRWNPAYQDPEMRQMMEQMMDVVIPMTKDLTQVPSPLPRGVRGFFEALGGWLSRALSAIGGWLLYGALVLVVANLLGGSAKLPAFLGTVSLYAIPGLLGLLTSLLGLLGPLSCLGGLLGLVAMVWSIVVYVKATSVATGLDGGRAVVAVFAPFVVLLLVGILLAILVVLWMAILF